MTEFQRAAAVVDTLEILVTGLSDGCITRLPSESKTGGMLEPADDLVRDAFFVFDPQPRQEISSTGDDWVVVGKMSAFDCQVSDASRTQFVRTRQLLEELAPVMERMRRRCRVRAELEVVRSQLSECLPEAHANAVAAVQDLVSSGGLEAQALEPLLTKALELERAATYGAKMAGQASELIARFDAAYALYNTDVVPRLAAAVAAAEADDAEQRAAAIQAEAALVDIKRQQAQEEERQLLARLLEASEQGLQRSRLHSEEQSAAKRRAEAAWTSASRRCGAT